MIVGNNLLELEVNEVLGIQRTFFLLRLNWRWCDAFEIDIAGSRRGTDTKENEWELGLGRGLRGRV